jgi:hypothetical protein
MVTNILEECTTSFSRVKVNLIHGFRMLVITRLYDITMQKFKVILLTAMRTENLIYLYGVAFKRQ